ncbi:hypothetical protein ACLOJK_010841 [Asimina triloba]
MSPSSLFPFPLSSPSAATPVWPCPQFAVNFRRIFLRAIFLRSSSAGSSSACSYLPFFILLDVSHQARRQPPAISLQALPLPRRPPGRRRPLSL